MRKEVIGNATLCAHHRMMIAQSADQRCWCLFCADCFLHGDRARTRKAAERKWAMMVGKQAIWRARGPGFDRTASHNEGRYVCTSESEEMVIRPLN